MGILENVHGQGVETILDALNVVSVFSLDKSRMGRTNMSDLISSRSGDVLVEALREISRIAHMGGLVYMSEPDALIEIRKLTLPYFNTTESVEETKQALATYDKIREVKQND